jgi:hypothetical protein
MIIYIDARDIYFLPSRSLREGYVEYVYGVSKRLDAFENQFFRFGPFHLSYLFPHLFVVPRFSRATPRDSQIRKRAQDYSPISITRSCDILHKTLGYFSPFGRQCSCYLRWIAMREGNNISALGNRNKATPTGRLSRPPKISSTSPFHASIALSYSAQ